MRATGIVRRIDDLGRVVIPKEVRRQMGIKAGDPLEIYTERDGVVCFKRYEPIGEYEWEKAKNILIYLIKDEFVLLDRYGIPKAWNCEDTIAIGGVENFNRNLEVRIEGDVECYLAVKGTTKSTDKELAAAVNVLYELFNQDN